MDARAESESGLEPVHVYYNGVSPDYLRTFGTRLLSGRGITPNDRSGAPLVALVNQTLARSKFGAAGPLGRRLRFGKGDSERRVEIVGVVEDAKYRALRQPVPPTVYVPIAQDPESPPNLSFVIRTTGPVAAIAADLRRLIERSSPGMSYRLTSFSAQVAASLIRERAMAQLCGAFGALALTLAAIGVYGVLAYLVAQRQSEIGIRIALGGTRAAVRRLLYKQSFTTCIAGISGGLLLAFLSAGFARALLYGLSPADPRVYIGAAAILGAVATVATVIPAVRGSRTDPARVLKCE